MSIVTLKVGSISNDKSRRKSMPPVTKQHLVEPTTTSRRRSDITRPTITIIDDSSRDQKIANDKAPSENAQRIMPSRSTSCIRSVTTKSTYLSPKPSLDTGDKRKRRASASIYAQGRRTMLTVEKDESLRSQSAVALNEPTKDKWKLHAKAHMNSILAQMENQGKDKWNEYVKKHIAKHSKDLMQLAEKKTKIAPVITTVEESDESNSDNGSDSEVESDGDKSDSETSDDDIPDNEHEKIFEQVYSSSKAKPDQSQKNTLRRRVTDGVSNKTKLTIKILKDGAPSSSTSNNTKSSISQMKNTPQSKPASDVNATKLTVNDPLKSLEDSIFMDYEKKLKEKTGKDEKSDEIDQMIRELNLDDS